MSTLPRVALLLVAASCADPAAPESNDIGKVARSGCILTPTVAPASVTLAPGDTARVEAHVQCTDAGAAGFTWTSADSAVAIVTPRETVAGMSAAVVLARGVGEAVVTARSTADPALQNALAVTVRAPQASTPSAP